MPNKAVVNWSATKPHQRTAWYAVSIVPCTGYCGAVRALTAKRWLSAEAPRFPVAGCDAAYCDCRYKHHEDRRAKDRRLVDREGIFRYHKGSEQRTSGRRGRRESDH